jgi:SAM-dependent methyltransferase
MKTQNRWVILFLSLFIILLFFILYKKFWEKNKKKYEGFSSQSSSFELKQNNSIYDSFYAMIYDDLYKSPPRAKYEYQTIIDLTQPSKENSIFLDVGSGTGHLVNKLIENGYKAFGIDISQSMIDASLQKFPNIQNKCGNATDTMAYDRNTFTHITCLNFTIYHFEDLVLFLRNCYFWLVPNGYFIVHLVNKQKYNPIVPIGNPPGLENPQKYAKQRITDAFVDFKDFTYKNSVDFQNKKTTIMETFTDTTTQKIRQNETTLYMKDLENMIYVIEKCGFIVHGQASLVNDEYQYIYIFEKQQ